ncbi:CoA transferase [Dietzia lutea]|uniref:CoA transferase n=1 Tax=Dietzia lutea TaxID=546160 RepID=UPI0013A597A9
MQDILAGVRVLDLGQYIAAPAAGQRLADLGAEVIKIEPPGGEQARAGGRFGEAMVRAYNRGKRGLVLDLRHPVGREALDRLLHSCDVLIHNMKSGSDKRLGIDGDRIQSRHPHVVCGQVGGFGRIDNTYSRLALDIAAQAEFGIMHATGEEGAPRSGWGSRRWTSPQPPRSQRAFSPRSSAGGEPARVRGCGHR